MINGILGKRFEIGVKLFRIFHSLFQLVSMVKIFIQISLYVNIPLKPAQNWLLL